MPHQTTNQNTNSSTRTRRVGRKTAVAALDEGPASLPLYRHELNPDEDVPHHQPFHRVINNHTNPSLPAQPVDRQAQTAPVTPNRLAPDLTILSKKVRDSIAQEHRAALEEQQRQSLHQVISARCQRNVEEENRVRLHDHKLHPQADLTSGHFAEAWTTWSKDATELQKQSWWMSPKLSAALLDYRNAVREVLLIAKSHRLRHAVQAISDLARSSHDLQNELEEVLQSLGHPYIAIIAKTSQPHNLRDLICGSVHLVQLLHQSFVHMYTSRNALGDSTAKTSDLWRRSKEVEEPPEHSLLRTTPMSPMDCADQLSHGIATYIERWISIYRTYGHKETRFGPFMHTLAANLCWPTTKGERTLKDHAHQFQGFAIKHEGVETTIYTSMDQTPGVLFHTGQMSVIERTQVSEKLLKAMYDLAFTPLDSKGPPRVINQQIIEAMEAYLPFHFDTLYLNKAQPDISRKPGHCVLHYGCKGPSIEVGHNPSARASIDMSVVGWRPHSCHKDPYCFTSSLLKCQNRHLLSIWRMGEPVPRTTLGPPPIPPMGSPPPIHSV